MPNMEKITLPSTQNRATIPKARNVDCRAIFRCSETGQTIGHCEEDRRVGDGVHDGEVSEQHRYHVGPWIRHKRVTEEKTPEA